MKSIFKEHATALKKAIIQLRLSAIDAVAHYKMGGFPQRESKDFGKHVNDFEKRCCFRDQIEHIGEGTLYGTGEEVKVKMQSGKTAIYRLFSERYDYTFDDTGQKNWRYLFIKYEI